MNQEKICFMIQQIITLFDKHKVDTDEGLEIAVELGCLAIMRKDRETKEVLKFLVDTKEV